MTNLHALWGDDFDDLPEVTPPPPHPLAGVRLAQAEASLVAAVVSLRQARVMAGREADAVARVESELAAVISAARGILRRIP